MVTLSALDRRVTRLTWTIYGWGVVLTAEMLVMLGMVLWWDR
jgi:hypothetical protein